MIYNIKKIYIKTLCYNFFFFSKNQIFFISIIQLGKEFGTFESTIIERYLYQKISNIKQIQKKKIFLKKKKFLIKIFFLMASHSLAHE